MKKVSKEVQRKRQVLLKIDLETKRVTELRKQLKSIRVQMGKCIDRIEKGIVELKELTSGREYSSYSADIRDDNAYFINEAYEGLQEIESTLKDVYISNSVALRKCLKK